MNLRKNMFLIALAICVLFAVAGVSAGDVNDTLGISEKTGELTIPSTEEVSGEDASSAEDDMLLKEDDGDALSFMGSDANDGSEISAYMDANKLKTTYGSGENFQVSVFDSDTKMPVANAKLLLKIYTGKKYKKATVTTDYGGVAQYPTSKMSIGNHKIVISCKSANVKAEPIKSSVKVSKATLAVSAPSVTNKYGESQKFLVTVKNKKTGEAMKNVKVTMKVYTGKKYATYKLKSRTGTVDINTKTLSKGKHKVIIKIKGTENYKAKSAKSTIRIADSASTSQESEKAKIKTHFEFNDVDYNYYADGTFHEYVYDVSLYDENGHVLVKPTVLKWGSNRIESPQESTHNIVITRQMIQYSGDYAEIVFEGDDKYESCSYKLR